MSNIDIHISVDDVQVEQMLTKLGTVLAPASLAEFLNAEVEPYYLGRAEERFTNEGDAASGKWADLHPHTQRIRAYRGFPPDHPINVRTGALKQHVLTPGATALLGDSAAWTWPAEHASGTLGEKFDLAQNGLEDQKRSIPKRPVVAWEPGVDIEAFMTGLQLHIEMALA